MRVPVPGVTSDPRKGISRARIFSPFNVPMELSELGSLFSIPSGYRGRRYCSSRIAKRI